MQVYHSLAELGAAESDFGLALGVFDGVHLGHRSVIDAARGCRRTGVLTFEPHPVQVLAPDRAPRRILATMEHKMQILDTLGVDFLVVIEFSREFASGEARVFADELLASGVRRLAAGEDTVWSDTASKLSSEIASTTVIVRVLETVPSMMLSSTPVTVMVCGVSQLAEVKVRVPVTVASPVSLEDMERTTSESG